MKIRVLLFSVAAILFSINVNAQCSVNTSPGGNCALGDQIDALTIGGISSSNSTGCSSGGYGGPHNSNWVFKPGGTYAFSITCGGGVYNEGVAIWIDLNGDGFYGTNEMVWGSNTTGQSFSGNLTIPSNAQKGVTRLRIRCAWITTFNSSQACQTGLGFGYMETEDYNIVICEPPAITTQPQNSFACENGTGNVSLAASGADSYQWQTNIGSGWTNISNNSVFSGTDKDTLKFNNTPVTMHGNEFRCIVGACSNALKDTSDAMTLDVFANTEIEAQTFTDTSCIGLNTKFFVKSKGVVTNYRWQIYSNTTGDYEDVTMPQFSQNNDTLTVVQSKDTLNGAKLRCIVNGLCGADTSADIDMTVQALPAVVTDPVDITLDQGHTAVFQVTAVGVGIKYQWQVGVKDTFSNVNNGGIYQGVTTDRLVVRGVAYTQNGYQFKCIVRGVGSCAVEPDTSSQGVLYVNVPNSVGGLDNDENIAIFPNPVNGNDFTIQVDDLSILSSYTIIDKMGRVLAKGEITSNKTVVNIAKLASGVYTLNLTNDKNQVQKAVQITKL